MLLTNLQKIYQNYALFSSIFLKNLKGIIFFHISANFIHFIKKNNEIHEKIQTNITNHFNSQFS